MRRVGKVIEEEDGGTGWAHQGWFEKLCVSVMSAGRHSNNDCRQHPQRSYGEAWHKKRFCAPTIPDCNECVYINNLQPQSQPLQIKESCKSKNGQCSHDNSHCYTDIACHQYYPYKIGCHLIKSYHTICIYLEHCKSFLYIFCPHAAICY